MRPFVAAIEPLPSSGTIFPLNSAKVRHMMSSAGSPLRASACARAIGPISLDKNVVNQRLYPCSRSKSACAGRIIHPF